MKTDTVNHWNAEVFIKSLETIFISEGRKAWNSPLLHIHCMQYLRFIILKWQAHCVVDFLFGLISDLAGFF